MSKKYFRLLWAVALCILMTGCASERHVAVNEDGAPCKATLAAVGDIYLTQEQMLSAAAADGSYDFSSAFSAVAGELTNADLAVGNLEGNFCGAPYDTETRNYPEALATALQGAGLDVLQTANTYTIQNGLTGVQSTLQAISNAGMQPLGTFASQSERDEHPVLIREVNGIKIAMLAFTKGVNNVRLPEGTEYCVNLLYSDYDTSYSTVDTDAITACIEQAKAEQPDVIIAMVHWGSEYDSSISDSQTEIEDLLFQNGVDVILGSHSHLAGKIAKKQITDKDGKKKNVLTAYSLGNFYGYDEMSATRESLILQLEFTKYDDGTTEVSAVDYTPIYLADCGEEAVCRYPVIHVENAISLYESHYYDRVSEELYDILKKVPADLKEQVEDE